MQIKRHLVWSSCRDWLTDFVWNFRYQEMNVNTLYLIYFNWTAVRSLHCPPLSLSVWLTRKLFFWLRGLSRLELSELTHFFGFQFQAPAGSRDSQKSNHGIFRDFQEPLNDCILRLFIPFIDHNNLFWDVQFLSFWFFSNQYSAQTNISHLVSDARRNQSINQTFISHLFPKPMSLDRARLDLTITQASTFSGARQAAEASQNSPTAFFTSNEMSSEKSSICRL